MCVGKCPLSLQVEEADSVFERMKTKHVRPDTPVFNTLIGAHGRKGELRKAFKLFNDVCENKARSVLITVYTLCVSLSSSAEEERPISFPAHLQQHLCCLCSSGRSAGS